MKRQDRFEKKRYSQVTSKRFRNGEGLTKVEVIASYFCFVSLYPASPRPRQSFDYRQKSSVTIIIIITLPGVGRTYELAGFRMVLSLTVESEIFTFIWQSMLGWLAYTSRGIVVSSACCSSHFSLSILLSHLDMTTVVWIQSQSGVLNFSKSETNVIEMNKFFRILSLFIIILSFWGLIEGNPCMA